MMAGVYDVQLCIINIQTALARGMCKAEDLDEMNIEIMRNTLYKAYLDDFAQFCAKLGGATSEIMADLLAFEVSRHCPILCHHCCYITA